jgi:hypothetical protein
MKKRIIFIAAVLFIGSLSLMCLWKPKNKESREKENPVDREINVNENVWSEKFYIGAMHDGIDCKFNYTNLKTLGFNLLHLYALGNEFDEVNVKYYPKMFWGECGNIQNDILKVPVNNFADDIGRILNEMNREIPGMRIVMMRPVIEYLCRGQRSDYQCEQVPATDELWFYAFNNHETGKTVTDNVFGNGAKVMYCQAGKDDTGKVVWRLRSNNEQSHRVKSPNGNEWHGDSYCLWKIKPRIRVPSGFPESNRETPVCKIKVIADDGITVLKETIIRGRHFLIPGKSYDGGYVEEYNWAAGENLDIKGDWGDKWGRYEARDLKGDDSDPNVNKSDIQVFWFGTCDMWIDYVRVDDDIAGRMLKEPYGDDEFNKMIEDEITKIGMISAGGSTLFMNYYIEGIEFNQLSCTAFLNEKLKNYSNGKINIIQDLTNTLSLHVSWSNRTKIENPQFLKKYFIDKVGCTQILTDSYPLTGCFEGEQKFSRIPNTLPVTGGNTILARAVSPDEYDIWLQENLNHYPYQLEADDIGQIPCSGTAGLVQDRGNFRYRLELGNALSKLTDIPLIFIPQAHQWFRPTEVRREPTNEELNMMINTSLCYGVKGILYFAYNSEQKNQNGWYGTGIADENGNLRLQNFYGQTNPDKVQTIQGISERVAEKWGPYLMKFDNAGRFTSIFDFEMQRRDFLNNSYFSEIRTFPPAPSDLQKESSSPDNLKFTYIQAAVFNNPAEKNAAYFMIVNRRCSPFDSGKNQNGGRRKIKIKFDINGSVFSGSEKWTIVDLYNESVVTVFGKSLGTQIDLGWFMPGEGKLYKIIPSD